MRRREAAAHLKRDWERHIDLWQRRSEESVRQHRPNTDLSGSPADVVEAPLPAFQVRSVQQAGREKHGVQAYGIPCCYVRGGRAAGAALCAAVAYSGAGMHQ